MSYKLIVHLTCDECGMVLAVELDGLIYARSRVRELLLGIVAHTAEDCFHWRISRYEDHALCPHCQRARET